MAKNPRTKAVTKRSRDDDLQITALAYAIAALELMRKANPANPSPSETPELMRLLAAHIPDHASRQRLLYVSYGNLVDAACKAVSGAAYDHLSAASLGMLVIEADAGNDKAAR